MRALIVCLVATTAAEPVVDPAAVNPRLLLVGHRAELDASAEPAELRFSVLARNSLPVGSSAVDVGLLFAADEPTLRAVDPGVAYRSGEAVVDGVGVVRRRVAVLLPPGEERELTLTVALAPGLPPPRVFRTHVLSYRLSAVPPSLLFELVQGEAAPDEGAVVETLALAAGPVERLEARRRWAGDTALTAALVGFLAEPVGEDATHQQTLAWVFAVRTLGVLGGELAHLTLQPLLADTRMTAFDESLQVVRIARMEGSRLETPLAYAVPLEARRMQDVVAAALTDVRDLEKLGQPTTEVGAEPAAQATSELASEPDATLPPRIPAWVVAAVVGIIVGALAAWLLRARRPPPPAAAAPTEED